MEERVSTKMLYAYMLGMLLFGAYDTIGLKLHSLQHATGRDGGPPRPYNHSFLMAAFSLLGQSLNLVFYYVQRSIERRRALLLAHRLSAEEISELLYPE